MSDFAVVESLFCRLLSALNGVFSVSEIAEVSEFVDVGEYGLALETAVDIFVEEGKVAEDDVIVLVQSLANAMELPAAEYSERLRTAGRE
ncbi:MafI family immunity protein [Massilia endophytica]|uniref:MafI family immunity protein n=1 Tax=Massilia endophytica TaxID=2899220 RepID=UPI001E591601|nr:MafI family immunity protein [Massilia endophytica]UGQ48738.1 MafI family immunity protein [Massilia endophytica]